MSAAGGSFTVFQKGTAKYSVVAESGEIVNISVADTLISDKFPFRLWAMQSITNKGGVVTMRNDHMSIFLPGVDSMILASKNSVSRLFVVKICVKKE